MKRGYWLALIVGSAAYAERLHRANRRALQVGADLAAERARQQLELYRWLTKDDPRP